MENNPDIPRFPMPFRGLLLIAGMYTVAWGAFFKWFGAALIQWLSLGMESGQGLDTGWYGSFGIFTGLLIFLSALYPTSWLYLILAGILGKMGSALWFILEFESSTGWNKRSIFHLVFNELLWVIPLVIILVRAFKVKNYLKNLPE